ncbi:forkhead box protein N2 [Sigmodon hispidus]
MGPVIEMTPHKRAETPGAKKVAGLSHIYIMGSLPEEGDAAMLKATLVGSDLADDELTNLNWLHEMSLQKKRGYSSAFSALGAVPLQQSHSPAASIDPKGDHNYSASSVAAQRCASRVSVSSLSSVDEVYEFIPKSSQVGSDSSEGFHSEDDSDADDEDDPLGLSGCAPQAQEDTAPQGQPGEKMQKQSCQEIDEELKEAAGLLLHPAGISTCLGSLISTAKA